jgi:hypothetical protein
VSALPPPPSSGEPSLIESLVGVVMRAVRALSTVLLVLAIVLGAVGLIDTFLLLDITLWWVAAIVGIGIGSFVAGALRYRHQLRSAAARQARLVEVLESADETGAEALRILEAAEPQLHSGSPLTRLRAGRRVWKQLAAIPDVATALDLHEDVTGPSMKLVWWSLPVLLVALLAMPILAVAAIFL